MKSATHQFDINVLTAKPCLVIIIIALAVSVFSSIFLGIMWMKEVGFVAAIFCCSVYSALPVINEAKVILFLIAFGIAHLFLIAFFFNSNIHFSNIAFILSLFADYTFMVFSLKLTVTGKIN